MAGTERYTSITTETRMDSFTEKSVLAERPLNIIKAERTN
jgi:hypothetical protein